jgi:EmrB/QacA subfamily drug resistance transporter
MSLLVICLGFFMTLLDLTIVNIAIPSIMTEFDVPISTVLWVLNAYTLALVAILVTAGRLGDRWGAKRLFIGGLVLFTAASAFCGWSSTIGELIAWRAVQGVGAAIIIPQTLTILTASFPPAKRGAAFGIWGAISGVAIVAGPTLGGLLVTSLSWRWIFFVNVPIGVTVIAMAIRILMDYRTASRHRIDVLGVLLSSAGLLILTYAVTEGQHYDWGTVSGLISIPLLIVVGAVLIAVFVWQQYRRQDREPLVPFLLFRDRNYAVMSFVSLAISVGMIGFILPLTIYLQSVLGFSALKAGLTIAPMAVVSIVIAPLTGWLSDRTDGKYIMIVGMLFFAVGLFGFTAEAKADSGQWGFVASLIAVGVGMGCTFAPMSTIAMRDVQPAFAGAASGVMNTVRQIGSVIGTVAVGVLLQAQLVDTVTVQARSDAAQLPGPLREPFVQTLTGVAKSGMEGAASGSGTSMPVPPGVSQSAATALRALGQHTFDHAYVAAMRPTLLLPALVLVAGAATALLVRRSNSTVRDSTAAAVEAAANG